MSTGTWVAALAKAGVLALTRGILPSKVWILLPEQTWVQVPVKVRLSQNKALAYAQKDGGDDPDVTHGLWMVCRLSLRQDTAICFCPSKGLGIITKPGLSMPVGEVAINPVPRKMICAAVRQIFSGGVNIEVIIPKGQKIANKTFNPRLGIKGGISILGTTGRVRPFSLDAIQETIRLHLKSLLTQGQKNIVLVPGNLGRKGAKRLGFSQEIVEVSNEWDTAFAFLAKYSIHKLVIIGHPGKLFKFILGYFNTHSKKSPSAVPVLENFLASKWQLTVKLNTVEQGLKLLTKQQKIILSQELGNQVIQSIQKRYHLSCPIDVFFIDYSAQILNFS